MRAADRPRERVPEDARRATSGSANAIVLPLPVRPRPSTSRPASESGSVADWIGNADPMPCVARQRTSSVGTPSSAKDVTTGPVRSTATSGAGAGAGARRSSERRESLRRCGARSVLVGREAGADCSARGVGAPALRVAARRRGRSARTGASGVGVGGGRHEGPFADQVAASTCTQHGARRRCCTGSAFSRASGDRGASLGGAPHPVTGPEARGRRRGAPLRRGGDHRGVSATRRPVIE